MPAKNPRLTITVKPSLKAQLERLSELTGNSQGALVSDLLEGSEHVFERLIAVLEAAKTARQNISVEISESLEEAQQKLENQLGLALEIFDSASKPILEKVEKVKRRSRSSAAQRGAPLAGIRGAEEARLTPPSNRGVRSKTRTSNTPIESKV